MYIFHQLFLLAFLAPLIHSRTVVGVSTQPNIVDDVKSLLIREESKRNGNQTQFDNFVGQIISLLNCGPFQLSPNSHLKYSLDYTTKIFRLFQTCDRYFETDRNPESLQVECKYKNWIFNKIDCEKISCPRLTAPSGGEISTRNNTFNITVYFWCSRGYSINGSDKLICRENGLWDLPPPTCEASLCSRLAAPQHGFMSGQKETTVNQTAEFSCQSGYSLIGNAVLLCQDDGRWDTTAPVCKKMCVVPDNSSHIEGLRSVPELTLLPIGPLLYQGQRVIYSCKSGYVVSSSGLSTCVGGTWRPPIRCRKICAVKEITNGKYALSKDSSTIEYFCLPGYQLVGQQKLSCTSDATWDSEVPVCTKLCTLPRRADLLSYRRRETYEIIPFGSQIVNGTKVYQICRSSAPQEMNVTECIDGELKPNTCLISRLQSGFLEILAYGKWHRICRNDGVCNAFGYEQGLNTYCKQCYDFDIHTYRSSSKIILKDTYVGLRDYSQCITCF